MARTESSSETWQWNVSRTGGRSLRHALAAVAVVAGVLGGSGCGFSLTPVDPTATEDDALEDGLAEAGGVVESPGSVETKMAEGHDTAADRAVVEAKQEQMGQPLAASAESVAVIKTEAVERAAAPAPDSPPAPPPAEPPPAPPPPPPPPPALPGPGVLALDRTALDFGSGASEHLLTIANHGGGIVAYTLETNAAWATLSASSGEVSTDVDTVTVTVARAPLYVGRHEATVTVRGDDGSVHVVPVTMEKPNTFPVTVPWLELGLATPEDLQVARDGLVHWRRVTDTVVLLAGPNQAFAYTTLQAEFPGLTIIPSIKSSPRTSPRSLDSIEAWQLMAADIAVVCAATGVNQVVLENETGTWNYLHGTETIDLEQFRQALSYLPTNIEITWYPGVSVSTDAALVARSVALLQVVEDVLHPRFADISFGDPDWPVYPPSGYARATMDNMAQQPTMPIVWVGYPSGQYWEYVDLPVAMEQIATLGETPADYPRPSYLLYMGQARWVEASQAVAELLWPVAVP